MEEINELHAKLIELRKTLKLVLNRYREQSSTYDQFYSIEEEFEYQKATKVLESSKASQNLLNELRLLRKLVQVLKSKKVEDKEINDLVKRIKNSQNFIL